MHEPIETLRRELEEAFRNRAHLYRLMLDELEAEIGPARAEALLARALERRGREVADLLFGDLPPEPTAIGDRFLSVSPDARPDVPARRGARPGPHGDRGQALPAQGRLDRVPACRRSASRRSAASRGPSTAACSKPPA